MLGHKTTPSISEKYSRKHVVTPMIHDSSESRDSRQSVESMKSRELKEVKGSKGMYRLDSHVVAALQALRCDDEIEEVIDLAYEGVIGLGLGLESHEGLSYRGG
jgi:hypothetical protein